jgi:hypothetical protein
MKEKQEIKIFEQKLKNNHGGFIMPEDYLEGFETDIIQKIEESKKRDRMVERVNWFYMSLTAAALLLISLFILPPQDLTDTPVLSVDELNWDQLTSTDETWMIENMASNDVSQNTDLTVEIDFLLDNGVSNEEIIEMMDDEVK